MRRGEYCNVYYAIACARHALNRVQQGTRAYRCQGGGRERGDPFYYNECRGRVSRHHGGGRRGRCPWAAREDKKRRVDTWGNGTLIRIKVFGADGRL